MTTNDTYTGRVHALREVIAAELQRHPRTMPVTGYAAGIADAVLAAGYSKAPAKHEHDGSGCIECRCNAVPWSTDGCTCPGGFS